MDSSLYKNIANIYIEETDVTDYFNYKSFNIKEVLNKDLDTGFLQVNEVFDLDIEPFDLVKIVFNNYSTGVAVEEAKYFEVATVTKTIAVFGRDGQTESYNYDLGLCSPTLELQRIILPNKTITNRLNGDNKTLLKIIQEYLQVYASDIFINTNLVAKLGDTEAKEMSWNRPTLFEVMNDLLAIVGCVVKLDVTLINGTRYRFLNFLDLYDKGNEIDITNVSDIATTQNMQNYCSALEVNASNVYDSRAITKTPIAYIPKTNESFTLTTENQKLVVQKPFFTVEECIVTFYTDYVNEERFVVDITDQIVEKSVYNTLLISNSLGRDTSANKKRNYLYFEQGKNTIEGMDYKEENWAGWSSWLVYNALNNAIYVSALSQGINPTNLESILDGFLNDEIVIDIKYTTTDDVLFRVNKENQPKHESVLINNQSDSNVYADLLGKQQQEFVNRIGNKEMIITGVVDDIDNIPNLNDVYGDFVVVQREYSINKTNYVYKCTLSEHYSADNMTASINTKKRYTSLLSASDAKLCNHLTENKVILTTNPIQDGFSFTDFTKFIATNYGTENRLQTGLFKTTYADGTSSEYFMLEPTTYAIGNNIVIAMRTEDNINVASKLNEETLLTVDVKALNPTMYVDSNGEYVSSELILLTDGAINNDAIDFTKLNTDDFNARKTFEQGCNVASQYPIAKETQTYDTYNSGDIYIETITYDFIDFTKSIYSSTQTRYKDNRETTAENIQFSFEADTNVFFTSEFIDNLPFMLSGDVSLKFAYTNDLEYNKYRSNNWIFDSSVTIDTVTETSAISFNGIDPIDMLSYGVFNEDNELLIAVNTEIGELIPIWLAEK